MRQRIPPEVLFIIAFFLFPLPCWAKWFWMSPPGQPPFYVNPDPHVPLQRWRIQKVYSSHADCKSDVALSNAMSEAREGPSDMGMKDNYCVSDADARWKGAGPKWLLLSGPGADVHSREIKGSFLKQTACSDALVRAKAEAFSDADLECISLNDPRWSPTRPKPQWVLVSPPSFGGETARLKDWERLNSFDRQADCLATKQKMPGTLCVISSDPRL